MRIRSIKWSSVVRPSVRPIVRPQPRRAAGLLLSAVRAETIDRQRRALTSSGAAARRSAANASSVTFRADVGIVLERFSRASTLTISIVFDVLLNV